MIHPDGPADQHGVGSARIALVDHRVPVADVIVWHLVHAGRVADRLDVGRQYVPTPVGNQREVAGNELTRRLPGDRQHTRPVDHGVEPHSVVHRGQGQPPRATHLGTHVEGPGHSEEMQSLTERIG
jgi:hypothetical protein